MIMVALLLAAGSALICWGSEISPLVSRICDAAAVIAVFAFYVITASAITTTIANDTVFMTEIHRIIVNPVLLASGAYLGPYVLGKMALALLSRSRQANVR